MGYERMTIKKAIQMIDEKELLLPHIQRPFVWKQDVNNNQTKRFFDSILREYPFGTFLFWITADDIQMRKFIQDYEDGKGVKETYLKSIEIPGRKKTLVLDGQQRLQALYLALKGTYNGKELYFDVLSGDKSFLDKDSELKYNFEYFKHDEVEKRNIPTEHYWVRLKRIALVNENTVDIRDSILKEMEEKGFDVVKSLVNRVDVNVSQIKNQFTQDIINFYPIDSTVGKIIDYDEILEIFIRVNSGGTLLSKSDLMFSLIRLKWNEAEEQFEDLLNAMNGQDVFAFDTDFILKTSLVLLNKRARYEIKKFKGTDGLESIESKWPEIVKSFYWLRDFLNYASITSRAVLPSYNALIPILYFAYIHQCKPNAAKMKQNMQTWLYKTLLNNNFSGQSDNVIDTCSDVIKDHSSVNYFPYKEIEDTIYTKLNKRVDIHQHIIDGNVTLVLNLVYLFNKQITHFHPQLLGNSPEIDHIFPRSKMMRTYGKSSQNVNNIGNYMFLEKALNIGKGTKLPTEFFPKAEEELSKRDLNFYERNFIPTEPRLQQPENFEEFVEKRREIILDTIKKVLIYDE